MPLSLATISKLPLPSATVEAAVTPRHRSPHSHSAEYRFLPIRCRVGFGMGIALCSCMSTSLQLLALFLAFVGSLIIALALARIILEAMFAVICRGLPTPHNGRGKRVVHSAGYQSCGTKARASSEVRAVVRYRYSRRLLEDRASFRTHRRPERRVAPLTTREGLSKFENGHPMASPEPSMLPVPVSMCLRRRCNQQRKEHAYRPSGPAPGEASRADRSSSCEGSRRIL